MAYSLTWKQPALDTNKATPIVVPVGSIVSDKASLRFTGKGAANYGVIQQENLMRLLENFADSAPPPYATVGQIWYDTTNGSLRYCSSTAPLQWRSLAGVQITHAGEPAPTNASIGQIWYNTANKTLRFAISSDPLEWKLLGVQITDAADPPPSPAELGDLWFQRTGTVSGTLYAYTGIGRYPEGTGAIGGWSQVWPSIETVAGREEYDTVHSLVRQLIDITTGGSGVLGKLITNLTDLGALDTAYQQRLSNEGGDPNVLFPTTDTTDELTLDPNSTDWDTLLAAARYAVNRLELPVDYVNDISPVPFVTDGRQAPASLISLATTNVRYPSLERRSNRRFGTVTLMQLFTETVNVLRTAIENRYSLKGINGTSGVNPIFANTTEVIPHVSVSGALDGRTSSQFGLRFNFADSDVMNSFLNSGGAIQVTLLHEPGGTGTAADTNLKALFDARGVVRLTADKSRVFTNALPLALAVNPVATGLRTGGTPAQTVAGASYSIGATWAGFVLSLQIDFSSTGPMNGTTTIEFSVIRDNETYLAPGPIPVYGSPSAYTVADKFGDPIFS